MGRAELASMAPQPTCRPWVMIFSHPHDFSNDRFVPEGDLEPLLARLGCEVASPPQMDPDYDPFRPDAYVGARCVVLVDPKGTVRGDLTYSTTSSLDIKDLLYLVAAIIRPA